MGYIGSFLKILGFFTKLNVLHYFPKFSSKITENPHFYCKIENVSRYSERKGLSDTL